MADNTSMYRAGVCPGCCATLCARRATLRVGTSDYRILRVWCPDDRCWNHEETYVSWERFEELAAAEKAALLRAADREDERQAEKAAKAAQQAQQQAASGVNPAMI